MQIHFEQRSEYRCQDCRETSVVFILAHDSELRLCESCFERLRDLSQSATGITAMPTIHDAELSLKSHVLRNRAVRLRLLSR
jgi:hypothetical protein